MWVIVRPRSFSPLFLCVRVCLCVHEETETSEETKRMADDSKGDDQQSRMVEDAEQQVGRGLGELLRELGVEDDDDDEWSPVDDHLSAAHDALFEGDAALAERECREALAAAAAAPTAPTAAATVAAAAPLSGKGVGDVYALLVLSLRMQNNAAGAVAACRDWGRACGASSRQLLALTEAAYLLCDAAALREAAAAMAAYTPRPDEGGALHAKVATASLVADAGLAPEADALMASCEALSADDDLEEAVDVLAAWADLRARPETSLRTLRERAAAATAPEASLFARDVAQLAHALLLLHTLETDGAAQCKAALATLRQQQQQQQQTGVDANISAVEALLAFQDNNKSEFARHAAAAANGANLLFTKRLQQAKASLA